MPRRPAPPDALDAYHALAIRTLADLDALGDRPIAGRRWGDEMARAALVAWREATRVAVREMGEARRHREAEEAARGKVREGKR
jgi:hypothetical protein